LSFRGEISELLAKDPAPESVSQGQSGLHGSVRWVCSRSLRHGRLLAASGETRMKKGIRHFLLVVVVAGAVIGWQVYQKGKVDSEARQSLHGWVEHAEGYAANQAYFESLFEEAHPKAFKASYSSGGRRRSSSFDPDKYADLLFAGMKEAADRDGKEQVSQAIQEVWNAYKAAPAGDGG
jgi:hypothetical protein